MRLILIILLLLSCSNTYAACDCGSTDSANPCTGQLIAVTVTAGTPNGGTAVDNVYSWSFNSGGGDARCGQFANGDYWIAPAVGQSAVTVTGISSSSHAGLISADVNPEMEAIGLLDGNQSYGNYSAGQNIIPSLPISYSANTSIVAAIQRNEATEGICGTSAIEGECADSYNVVTILTAVPENAGSTVIRPNISGTTKTILTWSDFDLTRLPSLNFLTGADAAGFAAIKRRWSHSIEIFGLYSKTNSVLYSEGGRAFRSHALIDDYGGGTAQSLYGDIVTLFSDDNTIAEKKPALAAILSYGLDIYHARFHPPDGIVRYWNVGATQHPGKFIAPVLLAALRIDQTYANVLKQESTHIHDDIHYGPHELGQLWDGQNGEPLWGDEQNYTGVNYLGSYWGNMLNSQCFDGASGSFGACNPALGPKNMKDPHRYIDGPPNKPGTSYMISSLGPQRALAAIMSVVPKVNEVVNFDGLIEYVDREHNYGLMTANDPCVSPDNREDPATCDAYRNQGCVYYGVTWGPVPPITPTSDCIKTATPPYTQVGRFKALDGDQVSQSYAVSQVESNWATMRAMWAGYRRASLNGTGSAALNGAGSLTIQ